ncbi:MAG: hypothetical protein JW837_11750 [Sedimentisphaerales bacterium]|nr:hypothetical protein [Sedimentisphaerales bacterium]
MKKYNRTAVYIFSLLALGFITAIWSQSGLGQDATVAKQDGWENYRIILERNIFSRQRGPRIDPSRRRPAEAPPAPDPESYYILKGIVQENGVFTAFIENTQQGQILKVREGDNVARGKVTNFNLDTIEYHYEDKKITVAMGYDMEGGRGTTTLNQMYELSRTYTPTSQTKTEESSSPSADEAEILKKLMERRRQQLGQ